MDADRNLDLRDVALAEVSRPPRCGNAAHPCAGLRPELKPASRPRRRCRTSRRLCSRGGGSWPAPTTRPARRCGPRSSSRCPTPPSCIRSVGSRSRRLWAALIRGIRGPAAVIKLSAPIPEADDIIADPAAVVLLQNDIKHLGAIDFGGLEVRVPHRLPARIRADAGRGRPARPAQHPGIPADAARRCGPARARSVDAGGARGVAQGQRRRHRRGRPAAAPPPPPAHSPYPSPGPPAPGPRATPQLCRPPLRGSPSPARFAPACRAVQRFSASVHSPTTAGVPLRMAWVPRALNRRARARSCGTGSGRRWERAGAQPDRRRDRRAQVFFALGSLALAASSSSLLPLRDLLSIRLPP